MRWYDVGWFVEFVGSIVRLHPAERRAAPSGAALMTQDVSMSRKANGANAAIALDAFRPESAG